MFRCIVILFSLQSSSQTPKTFNARWSTTAVLNVNFIQLARCRNLCFKRLADPYLYLDFLPDCKCKQFNFFNHQICKNFAKIKWSIFRKYVKKYFLVRWVNIHKIKCSEFLVLIWQVSCTTLYLYIPIHHCQIINARFGLLIYQLGALWLQWVKSANIDLQTGCPNW